jgi:hypothetical protein
VNEADVHVVGSMMLDLEEASDGDARPVRVRMQFGSTRE